MPGIMLECREWSEQPQNKLGIRMENALFIAIT
jgi:hypothetical protein